MNYITEIDKCKMILADHEIFINSKAKKLAKFLNELQIENKNGKHIARTKMSFSAGYADLIVDVIVGDIAVDEEDQLVFRDKKDNVSRWVRIDDYEHSRFRNGRYEVLKSEHMPQFDSYLKDIAKDKRIVRGITFEFQDCKLTYRRIGNEVLCLHDINIETDLSVKLDCKKEQFDIKSAEVLEAYRNWCIDGLDNLRLATADSWLKELYGLTNRMYVFIGPAAIGKTSFLREIEACAGFDMSFKYSIAQFRGDASAESRRVVYDALTKNVGFADEYSGWNKKTAEGWSNLRNLVTGESQFDGREMYGKPIKGKVKSSMYVFSNLTFLDSFEEYDIRRIAAVRLQKSELAKVRLLATRSNPTYSCWLELYMSCNAWIELHGKHQDTAYYATPEYSRAEVLLVSWLVKYGWYWPSKANKDDKYLIYIEDDQNKQTIPLTSLRQVNWKKLGLKYELHNVKMSCEAGEMKDLGRKRCFLPDIDSRLWQETLKNMKEIGELND